MTPLRGFIGPSAQGQFTAVNAERTVNWYLGKAAIAGGTPRSAEWLLGTPGLVAVGTAGTGPHRAAFQQDGRSFLISGTGFYEFFSDHSVTLRGTVAAGTDMGTIVSNGDAGGQLLVVVGGYGYVYNKTTNILTQIADPDFPQGTASMCCFLDGYGIVLQSSASTFQISALEDFTSWDALDVAQAKGGDRRGMQSALLMILKPLAIQGFGDRELDLRVDEIGRASCRERV